jgi:Outer membrane protein beta-barrel domain
MKIKNLVILLIMTTNIMYAQTTLKNYLNTGFGLYIANNSSSNADNIGNSATLNLEAELTKHSAARFSIDNYRIPLVKEINFNNAVVKSDNKANITSFGLDYGLFFMSKKWRFYAFVGGSVALVEEPQFNSTNPLQLSIGSENVTRWALRISPGIKYHFSDTFILFTEFQNIAVFYKNQDNKNLFNGNGLVLGIASKL